MNPSGQYFEHIYDCIFEGLLKNLRYWLLFYATINWLTRNLSYPASRGCKSSITASFCPQTHLVKSYLQSMYSTQNITVNNNPRVRICCRHHLHICWYMLLVKPSDIVLFWVLWLIGLQHKPNNTTNNVTIKWTVVLVHCVILCSAA